MRIEATARHTKTSVLRLRKTLSIVAVACLMLAATQLRAEVVTYRLDVDNTWSTTSHPGLFPEAAHFSWLGGGTHNDRVSFWNEGELASPGMVEMAESGVIDMLAGEVRSQIGEGKAFRSLAWRWWFCPQEIDVGGCGETSVEFEVDSDFPLVTLATMLGPSPDWFVGVSGLSLQQEGRWHTSLTVDLRPYDGGTRSANVWELWGPQNDPPEPIRLITDESGELITPASLGTMTFTLVSVPEGPTAVVEAQTGDEPADFELAQNYPNPFNSGTAIGFALPAAAEVELSVHDLLGQQVATLIQGRRPAGAYTALWDGRHQSGQDLASGLYFYRLRAGQQVQTRKLLLLR